MKKVFFKCTVVRRRQLLDGGITAPNNATAYIIGVNRLDGLAELGATLSPICGVPADRLCFFRAREVTLDATFHIANLTKSVRVKLERLTSLPAAYYASTRSALNDESGDGEPKHLFVFERTLNPRAFASTGGVDTQRLLAVYGDTRECRLVDTDPLSLAKAVSVRQFSQLQTELAVGMRADCQDNRQNWYPGSIVEAAGSEKKFRIRFDNFAPKWDEYYNMEHFGEKLRPLYTRSVPRANVELLVQHSTTCSETGTHYLFGQTFFVEGYNEWSCARFGAHILVQASHFLSSTSNDAKEIALCSDARSALSDFVDLLVDSDKENVRRLFVTEGETTTSALSIQSRLQEESFGLLKRLPFEVRIKNVLGTVTTSVSGELPFPFAVDRTIGNCLSKGHALVLRWLPTVPNKTDDPGILYQEPEPMFHESYTSFINSNKDRKKAATGISVRDCMDELCLRKTLPATDGYKCPRCDAVHEACQTLNLWKVPDVLVLHIKRFNMSAKWQEKLKTMVDFPITGLDMSPWCHKEAPKRDSIYDLIGTIDHHEGTNLNTGHYTSTCRATACSPDGREEAVYNFGRVDGSPGPGDSLWINFDDEQVKTARQDEVVQSTAFILMYRRRQLTASNVAKYSTLTK